MIRLFLFQKLSRWNFVHAYTWLVPNVKMCWLSHGSCCGHSHTLYSDKSEPFFVLRLPISYERILLDLVVGKFQIEISLL
jgi:hypothetical protein